MNDLVLCTTEDGRSRIQLRADRNTVWLTQLEKESLTTAADGKRYKTLLFNLDAILAVGYRVRSQFAVAI